MKVTAQLFGLRQTVNRFNRVVDRCKEDILNEMEVTGKEIESGAKQDAPVNLGQLRSSIYSRRDGNTIKIGVNANYGHIIEFGSKTLVDKSLKQDVAEYAAKLKGLPKSSGNFLESIKFWIKRKGIDESLAYPIMLKILRVGVKPKPYLFPNFYKALPKLRQRLKQIKKSYEVR
jgi:phage gpG-like protein